MNNSDEDRNPLTPEERRVIQNLNRGKLIGPGEWRQFCCKCGVPMICRHEWMRFKDDLTCDECRPPIQTANSMTNAFAPTNKETRHVQ